MSEEKVLVISKPIYNNILPLVDFPKNKDVFSINEPLESIIGEANVAAYILGKYGIPVAYTGIVGNDEAGEKFKNFLSNVNVNIKYIETDYEQKTDIYHTIINTEKIGYSHIKVNSMQHDLTKFKYDFNPKYIVFDDRDFSGANAALNNFPNIPAIFYGKNPNKDAINMCKRADYIVCNINFASKLAGMEIVLNKPKTIVNLYQKLVDLFKGVWIITLGEYGVIYCNNNNVKMIPALKVDVVDRDKAGSVFFGIFAYSIVSGLDIENAVRLANIGASSSLNQIGAINGILDLGNLLKHKKSEVQNNVVNPFNVDNVNPTNNVQTINPEVSVQSQPNNMGVNQQVQNNSNQVVQSSMMQGPSQTVNQETQNNGQVQHTVVSQPVQSNVSLQNNVNEKVQ